VPFLLPFGAAHANPRSDRVNHAAIVVGTTPRWINKSYGSLVAV